MHGAIDDVLELDRFGIPVASVRALARDERSGSDLRLKGSPGPVRWHSQFRRLILLFQAAARSVVFGAFYIALTAVSHGLPGTFGARAPSGQRSLSSEAPQGANLESGSASYGLHALAAFQSQSTNQCRPRCS